MEFKIGRLSWIIKVGPNLITKALKNKKFSVAELYVVEKEVEEMQQKGKPERLDA